MLMPAVVCCHDHTVGETPTLFSEDIRLQCILPTAPWALLAFTMLLFLSCPCCHMQGRCRVLCWLLTGHCLPSPLLHTPHSRLPGGVLNAPQQLRRPCCLLGALHASRVVRSSFPEPWSSLLRPGRVLLAHSLPAVLRPLCWRGLCCFTAASVKLLQLAWWLVHLAIPLIVAVGSPAERGITTLLQRHLNPYISIYILTWLASLQINSLQINSIEFAFQNAPFRLPASC